MSERRFSLAIEDVDSSESPESPPNKPLSGFLLDNQRPPLTKSTSFTPESKPDTYSPQRRFSICDLNTFGEEVSERLSESSSERLSQVSSPRSCSFKNHHRRNSVAIKFSLPRTASTTTSSENN
ncbi:hypothetical protein CXQ85_001716 [Candidozyma haemuli]|uniref:Uncharacterized protein n=1 Tax=Candidozyma haemuli TaxID=45357 RepID=A0A2V1APY0_9ASCO|nr:hypothetical protein CXQ85_001716 [[Candida] haemuloni]PVH19939.1 hypothetical protein CXQ85_001716 [[Candida] haemuloni]